MLHDTLKSKCWDQLWKGVVLLHDNAHPHAIMLQQLCFHILQLDDHMALTLLNLVFISLDHSKTL
jgi:hypothetical protein